MDPVFEPFLLSLIAGSSTVVGAVIVLMLKRISDRVVSFSLGFASGVMLLVAFLDLFLEAVGLLTHFELTLAFSLGAVIMISLDLAVPHIERVTMRENAEREGRDGREGMRTQRRRRNGNTETSMLMRSGMLIGLGITLHNFPEGLVVATGYTYLPRLGLIIAIAIMMHNIPEGLAMAIPLRMAGTKPVRVVALTLLSGLAEPVAALVAAVALSTVASRVFIGCSLAFAGGVMTYITADELIPVAHDYGYKHTVSTGLLFGIIFALVVDTLLS